MPADPSIHPRLLAPEVVQTSAMLWRLIGKLLTTPAGGNPKAEIRNPKEARNPNGEIRKAVAAFGFSHEEAQESQENIMVAQLLRSLRLLAASPAFSSGIAGAQPPSAFGFRASAFLRFSVFGFRASSPSHAC